MKQRMNIKVMRGKNTVNTRGEGDISVALEKGLNYMSRDFC